MTDCSDRTVMCHDHKSLHAVDDECAKWMNKLLEVQRIIIGMEDITAKAALITNLTAVAGAVAALHLKVLEKHRPFECDA